MVTSEIQAAIAAVEQNAALWQEINLSSRLDALDYLEFHVIDRIEGLLQTIEPPPGLVPLMHYAGQVKRRLEAIDSALFEHLRVAIRLGHYRGDALLDLVTVYLGRWATGGQAQPVTGYDRLDTFTNGLFPVQELPAETLEREPDMVYYQKTPARIIFELVKKARLTNEDVFYDLGSGLGHVAILVNLLSGATTKGIEVEPAYCAYAADCAAGLNLPRVAFIQADARTASYADGTVFFMYTPFEGRILQEVLAKLRAASRTRRIRLFTYGPCTLSVARQSWLKGVGQAGRSIDELSEFSSFPVD